MCAQEKVKDAESMLSMSCFVVVVAAAAAAVLVTREAKKYLHFF